MQHSSMTSIHSKTKTAKNDDRSMCNSSSREPSSTSNVNLLRKLFETNFKLSNITKPFKSKTNKAQQTQHIADKTGEFKENHNKVTNNAVHLKCRKQLTSTVSPLTAQNGANYLNCKIENCCCKTFFQQHNHTTTYRHHPLPKTPLRESNCEFNGVSYPTATSTVVPNRIRPPRSIPHNASFASDREGRNKVYEIKYQFYKSKSNVSLPLPKTIEEEPIECYGDIQHFPVEEKKPQVEKQSFRVVDFTAASMSEGGYLKRGVRNTAEEETTQQKVGNDGGIFKSSLTEETEAYKIGNISFKCRVPRMKNLAIREHSYPYAMKTSRLTVKGVKNRNMRNVKRRERMDDKKSVARCHTFSGYDNFAYHPSTTELQLPRRGPISDEGAPAADEVTESKKCDESRREAGVPATQFRLDCRMAGYSWPVTSFYIERDDEPSKASPPAAAATQPHANRTICDIKYSSSSDLYSNRVADKQASTVVNRKSNLKRHCSMGYLEEDYTYQFTHNRRRSLDNINKFSDSTNGAPIPRNLPKINNKPTKHKKSQGLDIHAHALFAAVEHGYVEKAKTILDSSDVDVNSLNSDGLSPLDVATLSNNKSLAKLLISYGAREGHKFFSTDDMRNHLYHLLHEAESRVEELGSSLRLNSDSDMQPLPSSASNIPPATAENNSQSKTSSIWERRAKGLKRMLEGFERIRPPDQPSAVTIEVTSVTSILVHFAESKNKDSSIATKFKVQWSMDKNFNSLWGHYEVTDTRHLQYHINNLRRGHSYYIRVACGNVKGYSSYTLSSPASILLSSWQDMTVQKSRFSPDMRQALDKILANVALTHSYLKTNVDNSQGGDQRRKKTTLRQLFTATSRFQKHMKRGAYLSCLFYHEDKVLVTNEDFLPVIEVDDNYPKQIHSDFHWLFKVAFSWSDLKWFKSDLEKCQTSSADFRIKLLQAAAHMQTALAIQELGRPYHKLIRDSEGTIVIPIISYIAAPKSVSMLNLKWLPVAKLSKRTNFVNAVQSNVADLLMASIPHQITYHQVSNIKLPKGLYLSYLKMRSSVDSLQVMVPSRAPNITPHCKIRDNPHVTAEEWNWLIQKENLRETLSSATPHQRFFIEQVAATAKRLFTYMQVPEAEADNYRLYDTEIIEVNKDVSLVMVVAPADTALSMLDPHQLLQEPGLLPLTVQVFEMVHFGAYQLDLISTYSRLSSIIEMDIDLMQQHLRQAFSSEEVNTAKGKVIQLETLHNQLSATWKKARWLLDVTSLARDRSSLAGTSMRHLLSVHSKRSLPSNESHYMSTNQQFPQPLFAQSAKSRGSWPGIGAGRHLLRVPNEISRSQQQLTADWKQSTHSVNNVRQLTEMTTKNEGISSACCSEIKQSSREPSRHPTTQLSQGSSSGSSHSVSSSDITTSRPAAADEDSKADVQPSFPSSAIIKIYAAYDTGLGNNPHFKFHISHKTTVREIVQLFVKQTNMSILLRGKDGPIYSDQQINNNFCLVAVVGAREHRLQDHLKPVQVERLWRDGKLYIRRKSNVLAAVECYSKHSSYV